LLVEIFKDFFFKNGIFTITRGLDTSEREENLQGVKDEKDFLKSLNPRFIFKKDGKRHKVRAF